MLVWLLLATSVWGGREVPVQPHVGRPDPITCRTSDYGVEPNARSPVTAGLQAAIDACSGRCGRVVVDLPGSYLTGGLLLTDCVHLEIPAGVALLASDRREDYGATPADWYALRFHRCDRCSLSGAGTIDGQAYRWCKGRWCDQAATSSAGAAAAAGGQASTASTAGAGAGDAGEAAVGGDAPRPARNWQDAACADPELCRPRLLGVLSSGDIQISGVRLTDAVYAVLHVRDSVRVDIRDVSLQSADGLLHADGLVVEGSRYVTLRGSSVDTAGDALVLKAPKASTEHVTVSDCSLRSRATAVRVGPESAGNLRYLSFQGLTVADCTRGLAVQLRDGGSVAHVTFQGVALNTCRLGHPAWGGAAEPVHVSAVPRDPATKLGAISDVAFRDVRAAAAENGIFVAGGPMSGAAGAGPPRGPLSISGLQLQRVELGMSRLSAYAGGCQDYRPSSNGTLPAAPGAKWWPAGLDCSSHSTAPIWVAGAERVTLASVSVQRAGPWRADWRRAAAIDPYSTRAVVLKDVVVT